MHHETITGCIWPRIGVGRTRNNILEPLLPLLLLLVVVVVVVVVVVMLLLLLL
jgi:hypothetical protein